MMEKKVITYKGKVVFEKITMPKFNRIPKLYEENEACFMFIEQGEFGVRSFDGFRDFNKNNALLAKCFNYFFEANQEAMKDIDNFAAIGVIFYPEIILELFDIKELKPVQSNFTIKKIGVTQLLTMFKENINYFLDNPALATENLIRIKLKEFIYLLMIESNAFKDIIDLMQSLFNPIVYDFRQNVRQHQYSNLNLEELAYLCNMSLSSFKRKFKEIYQENPKSYLAKAKIKKACQLLSNPNLTIEEISENCGFEYVSTLNRNFKKIMNCTPTAYRDKIRL